MTEKILEKIDCPAQLKGLSISELETLAAEIRQKIIKTVSKTGGHLAPSLGVVELTLALHYVFDAPKDKIIWDVGHQSYAHKLITGRRDVFDTLRTYGGISGFPKRDESPYDTFNTGHSSTSISAGLGISTAKALKGEKNKVIAVIGDGSMTAGMAFEALNQAGDSEKDLIVVLNDNEMSISPNVGAVSSFLSRSMTAKRFVSIKKGVENFIKSLPGVGDNFLNLVRRSEDTFMTFFTPGMLFEAFKFKYVGPIQGHKLDKLIEALKNTTHLEGPVLFHVMTKKGKGYKPAEMDPAHYHGVGSFEIPTGSPVKIKPPEDAAGKQEKSPKAPSYTEVFGKAMAELGKSDDKLLAITAAMSEGTGLADFAEFFPERFLDVGIAEQHAVTFAAGLATEGFKPVVAIYSTFLQRAYDQIIHDVCLPDLPVVFAIDRAGLVGKDGPTHHGTFDLSYLRCLPNMVIMAPKDENDLRNMLYTALQQKNPVAIRYPRGKALGVEIEDGFRSIPIGKAEILKQGKDMVIFAIGSTVYPAVAASNALESQGLSVGVVNSRFVKPLDPVLAQIASTTGKVLVVEENVRQGGFGSAVLELFNDMGVQGIQLKRVGLPDSFIEHGPRDILRKECFLEESGILAHALELMKLPTANGRASSVIAP